MIKTVILASCLALAAPQFVDPKNAKILKEQRFNAGDGRFGAAFAQEDGSVFREETSADGERVGQYSYIDQEGNTITVRYTAGRDGFRILEGDHIPEGADGLNSAPFDSRIAAGEEQTAPAPVPDAPRTRPVVRVRQQAGQRQRVPARRRPAPAPVQRPAPTPAPVQRQPAPLPFQQTPPQQTSDFNPFINPFDPTHLNFEENTNAAQFSGRQTAPRPAPRQPAPRPAARPAPRPAPQFRPEQARQSAPAAPVSVPACADCSGVNPFINPADSSHLQLFNQQQQQAAAPAFRPQQPAAGTLPASTFLPQQQQTFQPQQQFFQPQQQSFQPQQQSFQPQQFFQQPQQQTFQQQSPSFQFQQPSAQPAPLQPAFLQQPSQPAQPAQQFRTNQQLNSFQGQLNLNRFQSG